MTTTNETRTHPSYLVTETANEEPHFTVDELAKMWHKSRATIRRLVCHEPGVMKIRIGSAAKNASYSVPQSVARRIHMRLSV
jgi:hypothetical protein